MAPRIALAKACDATSASEWPLRPCVCAIITPPITSGRPSTSGWKSKPCPTLKRICNWQPIASLTTRRRHFKLRYHGSVLEKPEVLDQRDCHPVDLLPDRRQPRATRRTLHHPPLSASHRERRHRDGRFGGGRIDSDDRHSVRLAKARFEERFRINGRRVIEHQDCRLIARAQ